MLTIELIGYFSSMFTFYDRLNGPNSNELMAEMQHIEQQLDEIKDSLTAVTNAVKDSSLKSQYVSSQRIITESLRIAIYYLNMTEDLDLNTTQADIDVWHMEFMKWGSMVRESVSFLMDGLLGRGIIGSDIIKTLVEIEEVCIRIFLFISYSFCNSNN